MVTTSAADILFGRTRQAVLALFCLEPDGRLHLREIVRRTGGGLGAVQREVGTLARLEILTRTVIGRQVFYALNGECPLCPELCGLIVKTVGLGDLLRRSLTPIGGRIDWAFVYGSFARGEQRAGSDVDVMLVGSATVAEVVAALKPVGEKLGRELNPTLYTPEEFRARLGRGNTFLTRVMGEPKITLVGSGAGYEPRAIPTERVASAAHAGRAGGAGPVRHRAARPG